MKVIKKKHRLLSILLCLILVVGLMPITAFADTTTIDTIEASAIKAPVAGESATDSSYKSVTLPSEQGYELLDVVWYNEARCETEFTGTFQIGQKYYAEVWVDVVEGYQFADTSAITVRYEGKSPYTKEVRTGNKRMFFVVQLTCTGVNELNFTYDTSECAFDTSLTEKELSSKLHSKVTLSPTGIGMKLCSLLVRSYGDWRPATSTTSKISADRKYAIYLGLQLNSPYEWAEGVEKGDFSKLKITINGKEYKPEPSEIMCNNSSTVTMKYVPDDQKNKTTELTANVNLPKEFENPSYEVASDSSDYTVTFEKWYGNASYEYLGSVLSDNSTFKGGNYYMAELKFTATGDKTIVNNPTVDIDGAYDCQYVASLSDSKTAVVRARFLCPQHEHNYQTITTKATTSQNGSAVTKCRVCEEVKYSTTIYYPKTIKLSSASYTYNGYVISPTVSVIDANGKSLVNGRDYTVIVPSGRKDAGTYTYKVNFMGNYSGSKSLTMTINKASYRPTAKSYVGTYNGGKHYITFSGVKSGSVIKYRTSSTKPWTTTIPSRTSVGKTTVYYQITNKNFNTITGYKTIVNNPVKTSITKLSRGKRSFAVKWAKKTTQTTGYQIQYSTSSSFKSGNKAVTVTSNKATSKTIKGLKAKKKYYVRVRTYKTVSGVNFYSGWSTKKYVTTG